METQMYDPPTQSHMAGEVGGQDLHMGYPIPKPALFTEPESLHRWEYQLTPCVTVAREVLGHWGIPEPLHCLGHQLTPCVTVAREVLGHWGVFAKGT